MTRPDDSVQAGVYVPRGYSVSIWGVLTQTRAAIPSYQVVGLSGGYLTSMPADAGLGRILENSHRRGNYTSELAQPHAAGFEKDAADRPGLLRMLKYLLQLGAFQDS